MTTKSPKKSEAKLKITRETNIADIVFRYPDTEEILTDFGLHCAGCIASGFDTIETGSKVHSLTDEDIDELVDRLNEVVEHGE